jgi:Ca2+-transporting ATPase
MERKPRNPKEKMITINTLFKSLMQGFVIFAASFGIYYYMLSQDPNNASAARSMGIAVVMFANLFLVQVNSSDTDSVFTSIRRLAKDKIMWAVNLITILGMSVILYSPLNTFFKLAPLSPGQMLLVFALAGASVLWYEAVKWVIRMRQT